MINIILIFAISLIIALPLILLKKKISQKALQNIVRTFAISFFVLYCLRMFLNDNFIWTINGGTYADTYYTSYDLSQSLLRWGMLFACVVYVIASFYKTRTIKNWAIYVCLPIAIVCTFYYEEFLNYFLTNSGRAIWANATIRHIEFSCELILMLVIPILLRFTQGHRFNIKDIKEWLRFVLLLPCALLITIPVTLPQSLLGFTTLHMVPLSTQHIAWLVLIFVLLVIFYFAFRFKDLETRKMICMYLAVYLFIHYNSIYMMDLVAKRLPFQLCNLGSYLIILGLLINKRGFFDFVLLANVPGAMIAFCVPDIKEGMLSYWNIHFYIEHTWVFVLPLLIIALRILPRPNKQSIKHFFVGFTTYFVFCAVSGIIFNCFLYNPTSLFFNKVNYFYLFDTTVLETLPFLNFTIQWSVTLGGYTFYPIYMLMIFILYSIFCLICYWVLIQLFKVGDDHFALRNIKIDMNQEKGYYKNNKIPKKFYDD